jgi:hypothetical protein
LLSQDSSLFILANLLFKFATLLSTLEITFSGSFGQAVIEFSFFLKTLFLALTFKGFLIHLFSSSFDGALSTFV